MLYWDPFFYCYLNYLRDSLDSIVYQLSGVRSSLTSTKAGLEACARRKPLIGSHRLLYLSCADDSS